MSYRDYYFTLADQLARIALEHGVVLTMETKPTLPLAMGGYEVMVDAREARHQPEFCGNCDSPLPGGCGGCFNDEPACALHVFDLDKMCDGAMARVNDSIDATTHLSSCAVEAAHRRDVTNMHKRHDLYVSRARIAFSPSRHVDSLQRAALRLMHAMSPRKVVIK